MEFRNIITFLTVAEQGSFTGAANQLGYVQSTVTIQIKQLEEELGTILFDRIGKRVELTANGKNFMHYANLLVNISEQAKLIGKRPEEMEGNLRIGILESLLIWVLSEKLPDYYKVFSLIKVLTRTAPAKELFQMLKQNELDMVYFLGKKMHSNDFVCAWSEPVRIVFVSHPDNPFANKKGVILRELVEQPFILTENTGFYRSALEEIAMEQGISIQPLFVIDNTSSIIKLLKKGLGISFLPEYAVQESLINNELVIIDVEDCSIQLWIQLFYHKDKWLTPQMESFIKLIKNNN
ncbi:LysR family transcriptional regulator [Schinkia azotoformans]|uniref:LysR family transcriptional regulator n=1 Tax=Schinkia azotoformans TaxID=1454 RepID=UPI002DBD16EC|nr:LysR family transcriptional regulator [Schinkia azotoformans]MEC1715145.1 LysR family transcriptional regulator [Schinkia azotoformans]MEC1739805.1 LysR family transcriptional regulator [Schinkia azotoformans]MEC1745570.1 LysR family transcriptional regulator [Schinkia azotoformans]MEC1765070.1 LysR family transcriptional regulator [Schinkia azotoformans]MEC1788547.1 LysR family transcriptional regulator [Schinkia azotoformans]